MTLNNTQTLKKGIRICLSIAVLMVLGFPHAKCQQSSISGIVNEYSAVSALKIAVSSNPDSVDVVNPGIFSVNDIVMLYQPKGFTVRLTDGKFTGFYSNVGQYAFLIVDEIVGNTIVFNASTNFLTTAEGVKSQLIKVADYDDATVDGLLTAPAWDSASGTGGVVALYVRRKLTLNEDINVSSKGFKGADPAGDIYGTTDCYTDAGPDFKERYYTVSAEDSAGRKGEGAAKSNFLKTRGFGRIINGGGGGNGRYTGGGGGGNYTIGGPGGGQSDICGAIETEPSGEGGDGFGTTLYSNGGPFPNRIYFGGGGGTGTQDPGSGFTSTRGGNGGGIVVIVADTIVSNGGEIIADGENVIADATGAGGGGGGGGCIVLDANGFLGGINLSAVGGKGGDTNHASNYTGPGGGGGGGIYWVSKNEEINPDITSVGLGGVNTTLGTNPGTNGQTSTLIPGLQAPLNGFLFNTLPQDDTVCSDVIPPPIDASRPKGGLGPGTYTFLWESNTGDPTEETDWGPATGTNNQEDYSFPAPLADTTHFRRIVTSGTISDGDNLWVTYTVVPAITNNLIQAPDTVCQGFAPNGLTEAAVLGGANVGIDETYFWEENINAAGWTSAGGFSETYDPPALNTVGTYQYRRTVTSHVCVSVSNTIDIEVLEPISNNSITSRDTLCNGQLPELLDGGALVGGDPGNVWYDWEISNDGTSGFTNIGDQEDYTAVAPLFADRYYRRTVYSGIDSACSDVSGVFKIEVLNKITNNTITTSEDTVCRGSAIPGFGFQSAAGKPANGDNNYTYHWQVNPDASGWVTAASDQVDFGEQDATFNDPFNGISTDVRRVVFSGKDDVCKDTSNVLVIKTVPVITNNTRISDDTAACAEVPLTTILYNDPAGGNLGPENDYTFQWQSRTSGAYSDIPLAVEANYHPDPLSETTEFRRIVFSAPRGFCSDTSSQTVSYAITPIIGNNGINPDAIDYICFDQTLNLPGESPSGGDGTNYAIQWQQSTDDGVIFSDIIGADQEDYTENNYAQSKQYRRLVASDVCDDTSNVAIIAVRQLPEATLALKDAADAVICEKEVIFTVTITTDPPETYDWHSVRLDFTSPLGPGSVNSDENPDNPLEIAHSPTTDDSVTYVYSLGEVIDNKGCVGLVMNGSPSVKVYQKPDPELLFSESAVCEEVADISGSPLIGADFAEWVELGSDLLIFADPSAQSTTMQLDTTKAGYRYNQQEVEIGWRMVAANCADTATRVFTFYQKPSLDDTLTTDSFAFYVDDILDLAPFSPDPFAGAGAWTVDNSGASLSGTSTATGFTYDTPHTYTWTITNGVCDAQADELVIIQRDLRQYNAFSPDNDPFNQEFVIPGLNNLKANDSFTFILYNNWGTKVAEVIKDGTTLEPPKKVVEVDGEPKMEYIIWDGTLGNSGQAAPPGTYYYSLSYTINGIEFEPKKGYIILRR